jgi:hypothetical protein
VSRESNNQDGDQRECPISSDWAIVVCVALVASPQSEYPDQQRRGRAQPQIQAQVSPQFLAIHLQLPRKHANGDGCHGCHGGSNQVVVGGFSQRAAVSPHRQQIESNAAEKQRDRKMDQNEMLGMFRSADFKSKGLVFIFGSLDDDLGRHLWMD